MQTLTCGPFSNLDVNRSIMLDVWILGPEYWPPGSNLDGQIWMAQRLVLHWLT